MIRVLGFVCCWGSFVGVGVMLQLPTLQKEVRYFGVLYELLGAVLFLCIGIRLCRLGFVLGILRGFLRFLFI